MTERDGYFVLKTDDVYRYLDAAEIESIHRFRRKIHKARAADSRETCTVTVTECTTEYTGTAPVRIDKLGKLTED